MEEETEKIGLKKEDALRQVEGPSASNCRRNGEIRPSLLKGQHRIETESLLSYSLPTVCYC